MDFVLRNVAMASGKHGIKWEGKTLLDLNCVDNLKF